ncbi:MAG: RNA 2',3'-cyclic phosphodiesterase, partial [bacterium]|nr:RNA 2',3'-cyclic phosphodiesterase [bacterium]
MRKVNGKSRIFNFSIGKTDILVPGCAGKISVGYKNYRMRSLKLYKKVYLFYNPYMRIFIGIKLEAPVPENIGTFLKPFKKVCSPIKWTKPANLHITLKFIGDMDSALYSRMKERLNRLQLKTGPLEITLRGCGKFGKGGDLSIIWLGIQPNPVLE